MSNQTAAHESIPQGTLDMLILQTLVRHGRLHGFEIANAIQRRSQDVLRVEEGSLYPALQRMQVKGWLTSEWQMSELNRKARFYKLTRDGRDQLQAEMQKFDRVTAAIWRVLENA